MGCKGTKDFVCLHVCFLSLKNELVLVLRVKPIYISKGKDINMFCLTIQVEANESPASSISPSPSPKWCASSSYGFYLGEIWENHGWKKNAYFVNECDYPQSSECSDKLQTHDHLFGCRCSEEKLGLSPESYACEKNK